MTINGGSYLLSAGGLSDPLSPGAFADMTIGGYDGSSPATRDFFDFSIATYSSPIFGPGFVLTSPYSTDRSGFDAPSGDITDGAVTLNLDSWSLWRDGFTLNYG